MAVKSQESADNPQKQMESGNNSIPEISPEINSPKVNTQNSDSLFNHILQENRIFTEKNSEGFIKLFYYYTGSESIDIQLKEGYMKDYQIHTIGGQNYYPLILGYEEAKIMRQENLFTNVGDPIKNFYGKNVVVVGVMKKSDNIFDMIHIVPLTSGELN